MALCKSARRTPPEETLDLPKLPPLQVAFSKHASPGQIIEGGRRNTNSSQPDVPSSRSVELPDSDILNEPFPESRASPCSDRASNSILYAILDPPYRRNQEKESNSRELLIRSRSPCSFSPCYKAFSPAQLQSRLRRKPQTDSCSGREYHPPPAATPQQPKGKKDPGILRGPLFPQKNRRGCLCISTERRQEQKGNLACISVPALGTNLRGSIHSKEGDGNLEGSIFHLPRL